MNGFPEKIYENRKMMCVNIT